MERRPERLGGGARAKLFVCKKAEEVEEFSRRSEKLESNKNGPPSLPFSLLLSILPLPWRRMQDLR